MNFLLLGIDANLPLRRDGFKVSVPPAVLASA